MKPWEYTLHLEAATLREADKYDLQAEGAYFMALLFSVDDNGKPLIKKRSDLYDKAKVEELIYPSKKESNKDIEEAKEVSKKINHASDEATFDRLHKITKNLKELERKNKNKEDGK